MGQEAHGPAGDICCHSVERNQQLGERNENLAEIATTDRGVEELGNAVGGSWQAQPVAGAIFDPGAFYRFPAETSYRGVRVIL